MAMLAPAAVVTLTLLSEVAVRPTELEDEPTPKAAPVAVPFMDTDVVVKSLFKMILPFCPATTNMTKEASALPTRLPPDTDEFRLTSMATPKKKANTNKHKTQTKKDTV